jgi:predicted nucleic acid-binding protein
MILIDTNVVSEITRDRPNRAVQKWFNAQSLQDLFLCTPVLAELRYGIERLPSGRRRDLLDDAIEKLLAEAFPNRILPFDRDAAYEFGRIVAARHRSGRPIATMDGLIAAVAIIHHAAIATHDVDDFSDIGIDVIDPFAT